MEQTQSGEDDGTQERRKRITGLLRCRADTGRFSETERQPVNLLHVFDYEVLTRWSEEGFTFISWVQEFPSLETHASSVEESVYQMRVLLADVLHSMHNERREEEIANWQEKFRKFLRIEAFVKKWHADQRGSRDLADVASRKVEQMRALFLNDSPKVELISELMGAAQRAILNGGHPDALSASL